MADRLLPFYQVLPTHPGEMPFPQFIAAAQAAGASPRDWMKAKHAGYIVSGFNAQGIHVIRRPAPEFAPA